MVRFVWLGMIFVVGSLLPGGRASPSPGGADVRINEVLYDPLGADGGGEFVELFNRGAQPVPLDGWRLEAGNGARAGDWRVQWTGSSGDRIAAGGFFLIAGRDVAADVDARCNLQLQNGPDAVRLCSREGTVDLIGWGAHAFGEYYEDRPCRDVAAGEALVRVPDGADGDSNAQDLSIAPFPTPGATNAPLRALAFDAVRLSPPLIDACQPAQLSITLRNIGRLSIAPQELSWEIQLPAGIDARRLDAGEESLPAASVRLYRWSLSPSQGSGPPPPSTGQLAVRLSYGGGAALGDERTIRLGRGAVLLSELQYDPQPGEGEWVELFNRGAAAQDLAGWRLADASGRSLTIAEGVEIGAYEHLLIAEDAAGLRSLHPGVAGRFADYQGSWPTLNNRVDAESGYADELCLLDETGLAADCLRYRPGSLDGEGVTLERWICDGELVDGCVLIPCPGGATPGAGGDDRLPLPESGRLAPLPNPFFPEESGGLCAIPLPRLFAAPCDVTADIYSLSGERVATLAAGARAQSPLLLAWNGCDDRGHPLPTGLYLVRALVRSVEPARRERSLLRPLALVRR
jgi:hypothetical protein